MSRATARARLCSQAHTYLGLLTLLPLLLIAASGTLLGWYDELRFRQPPYGLSHPSGARLAPSELAQTLSNQFPAYRLEVLFLATASDRAVRARLAGPQSLTVFLHPATAEILDVRTPDQRDWLDLLYDFHPGKLFGQTGTIAAASTAVLAVVVWALSVLLGLLRQQGRVRTPRWRRRGGTLMMHRWLGFWLGPVVAVVVVTGAVLNFAGPLIAMFDPPPASHSAPGALEAPIVALLADRLSPIYRGAPVERIVFPKRASDPIQLRYLDGSWVFIDGSRQQVLAQRSPTSHWTRLLYPLHSGRLLGSWGPVLMSVFGLLTVLVLALGFRSYLRLAARGGPALQKTDHVASSSSSYSVTGRK